MGKALLLGGMLSLVAGGFGTVAVAQDCDAACQSDLREKVLRDLKALNDGERMA